MSLPPGMDPSMTPIGAPPPGVIPNFDNPDSRAGASTAVIMFFTVLMVLFVIVRMYTKLFISRSRGWDDYVCVFACLCAVAYVAVTVDVFAHGYATHNWDFPVSKLSQTLLQELVVLQAFYGPTIFFTKLCLFILYYRLFNPSRTMRYLIYFGVAFNIVFYLIYTFFYIFFCTSMTVMATAKCGQDLKLFSLITTVINILDDFYILLIPMSAISTLQLPTARKIGLLAVFFTGFLACCCSIISLPYRVILFHETDDVWNAVPAIVLGTVEFNIGLICSCLPTLPALFRRSKFASRRTKPSYVPGSDDSAPKGGAAVPANGASKRGFGRLENVDSRDSVAALEAGRKGEDEGEQVQYEIGGFQGEEEDVGRAKEWFRQARM
ncbi:MAG: hypothetical protein LQ348_001257 [Seirophora lacunosa]|nr:MAG: hypothetical protein LQ344_006591 [Seirophora lacunosa]KAI4204729.1 MAG: hypothetical protein LQ348_001257 [Seirophora lacunosa]